MQYSALLLLAATATSVTANMAMPAGVPKRHLIQARQTDDFAEPTDTSTASGGGDLDSACSTAADIIETSMPTAPADLMDYFSSYAYTDSCIVVPTSLASEYDDYTSSLDSWSSANSDDLSTFLAGCTDYSIDLISDYCTEDAGEASSGVATTAATTTADDSPKETGTKTSGGSTGTKATGSTTTTATAGAAAAREVGLVGAVLAGVLGVAVAL